IKEEAFQSAKIANWFLRKIGGIPIRRGTPDIDAVKAIMQVLKDNKKLLIYPEGTRNKEGTKDMAEFKEGAARFTIKAKKPIVPMIFFGSPKVFKKNYLYVGEPFEIDKFYGARTAEAYAEATQYIYDKMVETRKLCDEYVESRKRKKNKLSSQAN
ncbi:MAG: lysophospholipid acyltransferase family protein, partial [Clostridia bacterium]